MYIIQDDNGRSQNHGAMQEGAKKRMESKIQRQIRHGSSNRLLLSASHGFQLDRAMAKDCIAPCISPHRRGKYTADTQSSLNAPTFCSVPGRFWEDPLNAPLSEVCLRFELLDAI